MRFLSVRFHEFRNLENEKIDVNAENVFFTGENGQGKTNFLEALYLLSYGSSFRTSQDRDLITWGKKEMALHGRYYSANTGEGTLSVVLKDGNKNIKLNGKAITDRKNLLQILPVIAFVHDDFLFAGGPPERRRWFMDQTLSLNDPLYVDQLRRYRKLLKERNYLIKTRNFSLLNHYSEQLAFSGLALITRREDLTREFGKFFTPLYQEISGLEKEVTLEYKPSWGDARTTDEVLKILEEKKENDLMQGNTTSGPHRDKFLFVSQGRDFAKSASTGQKRLLSLVLRAAQARYYTVTTGKKPVLLLDDVLLELDPKKRQLFRNKLPETEQVFYTFLPGEKNVFSGSNAIKYSVQEGRIHVG